MMLDISVHIIIFFLEDRAIHPSGVKRCSLRQDTITRAMIPIPTNGSVPPLYNLPSELVDWSIMVLYFFIVRDKKIVGYYYKLIHSFVLIHTTTVYLS